MIDATYLYWTNFGTGTVVDVGTGTMGRVNLDGTGVNQSFITGATLPQALPIDAG